MLPGRSRSGASQQVLKNAERSSFRGAGFARGPGIQEHGPDTPMAWLVFIVSGPGPDGPSRNDARLFSNLLGMNFGHILLEA